MERPVPVLRHGPRCLGLQRVMPDAEVAQIRQSRRAAVLGFVIVVELAPRQWRSTTRGTAVLIASGEIAALS
ncbi:MAG: hypothetical protein K0S37_3320 [Microbacterium sp.]|nr:hypothetical protein [Microbacterium sp.]